MKRVAGLNETLCNLDGSALTENGRTFTIGYLVATAIARGGGDDPVRAMDIALRIYNAEDSVDLEDADFALAQQLVQKDAMTNLAKAAVLTALQNAQAL